MVNTDPKTGDGWDFLDDQSDAWYDAFETYENEEGEEHVDVDAYDEFANIQELVNFVAGTGTYQDTRQFSPSEEDLDMQKREMKNSQWKIPEKLEKIDEYLKSGAMRGEIDVDPRAETAWNVSETEAHMDGYDTKYTAHFLAYDPDEDGEGEEIEAQFYVSGSWYDTPPEQMNIEDVFNSAFPEKE